MFENPLRYFQYSHLQLRSSIEFARFLNQNSDVLTQQEYDILCSHVGALGYPRKKLSEISSQYSLSREGVRSVISCSIRKLEKRNHDLQPALARATYRLRIIVCYPYTLYQIFWEKFTCEWPTSEWWISRRYHQKLHERAVRAGLE
jgi:hypothetical protein